MKFTENDYEVVTYKVLRYLYDILRDENEDIVPSVSELHEILGKSVTDRYLGEILLGLSAEDYISGVEIEDEAYRDVDNNMLSVVLDNINDKYIDFTLVRITWYGLDYLRNDSTMNEVRENAACAFEKVLTSYDKDEVNEAKGVTYRVLKLVIDDD